MIKIDSLPLSKAYCNGAIRKAVLNGSVLYESAPQLDTPTNLSVTDTTASFDEVENAESYEFFVDDVSIGEYSTQTGYSVTITNNTDASWSDVQVTVNDVEIETYTESGNDRTYTLEAGEYRADFYNQEFQDVTVTGGVTLNEEPYYAYFYFTVSGDGTMVVSGVED